MGGAKRSRQPSVSRGCSFRADRAVPYSTSPSTQDAGSPPTRGAVLHTRREVWVEHGQPQQQVVQQAQSLQTSQSSKTPLSFDERLFDEWLAAKRVAKANLT